MGKKAKRRIDRLTRELAHNKVQLRYISVKTVEALAKAAKQIDERDHQIEAYKLGDPNTLATPIHFNEFLRLIAQLPTARTSHGTILKMLAPSLDNAVGWRGDEIPMQQEPGNVLPFRSVSYRIPVGSSSKRVDGWMLPSRVVVIDDGRRRHEIISSRELEYLQLQAQRSRP